MLILLFFLGTSLAESAPSEIGEFKEDLGSGDGAVNLIDDGDYYEAGSSTAETIEKSETLPRGIAQENYGIEHDGEGFGHIDSGDVVENSDHENHVDDEEGSGYFRDSQGVPLLIVPDHDVIPRGQSQETSSDGLNLGTSLKSPVKLIFVCRLLVLLLMRYSL